MSRGTAPRLLMESDVKLAGDVLAQAFMNDPLHRQLYPNPGQRVRCVPEMYRVLARAAVMGRLAKGVGDPLAAVALWTTPKSGDLGPRLFIRAGALRLLFTPLAFSLRRVTPVFRAAERIHNWNVPEPHVYLQVIGTRPEAQGQGYGAALLRDVCAYADAAGLHTYLETMTYGNVALYEHFGFSVLEEVEFPGIDLRLWGMKRPGNLYG